MTARGYEFYLRVRYRVEHEKIKFIYTSGHVIFCLLYKHTNDDDFMKISIHFPKIFQNCCKGQTNISEHFLAIFRRLPKITEDFRGGTDDVSIIQQHICALFKRLCSYSNGNLKNYENKLTFSRVK